MVSRSSFRVLLVAIAMALPTMPGAAFAATAQQNKMTTCNADAKTKALSGDARKAFMKECLSASAPEAKPMGSQQQKMVDCNAQAKTKALKGDERKNFMSGCLKGTG